MTILDLALLLGCIFVGFAAIANKETGITHGHLRGASDQQSVRTCCWLEYADASAMDLLFTLRTGDVVPEPKLGSAEYTMSSATMNEARNQEQMALPDFQLTTERSMAMMTTFEDLSSPDSSSGSWYSGSDEDDGNGDEDNDSEDSSANPGQTVLDFIIRIFNFVFDFFAGVFG